VIWVVNGFASFLPYVNSHFKKAPYSAGWTAFIGATVFEIGSLLGILEAWNRGDTGAFGWGVEEALYHNNRGKSGPVRNNEEVEVENAHIQLTERGEGEQLTLPTKTWIWFSLDRKYWHEMGYLAAFFQLLGATVFWISGFTALPTIQQAVSKHSAAIDGVYWTPQVIGGSGFIISSIFIMIESQKIWWKPRVLSLGWQIGFWNFIGAIGFTLSGALGFSSNHGAQYQCACATFWGSWGFLIGSALQWYESVNSV
jgi:hypothetical protein